MSVDPDDITPAAIRDVAPRSSLYGAPVLPGAMMLGIHAQGASLGPARLCDVFQANHIRLSVAQSHRGRMAYVPGHLPVGNRWSVSRLQ